MDNINSSDIDIPPEKQAALTWYDINYQKDGDLKKHGITDILLVTPPEVIKTGEDEDKDRFWGAFFKNDKAIDTLFRAVISTDGLSLISRVISNDKGRVITASKYREDFAIWRKSLQIARMKDGKRWIESSKKIADIAVLLYLIENILLPEKEFSNKTGSSVRVRMGSIAESWSNEMSKVLTDLYGTGGSITSVLEEKDKICIKYKKKVVEALNSSTINTWATVAKRRSRVENFDVNVLGMVDNLDALLNNWSIFEQRTGLSLVCNNIIKNGEKLPQFVL